MPNDPKETSQHDRDRLWRAVDAMGDRVDKLAESVGEKVDELGHSIRASIERIVSGFHDTSTELERAQGATDREVGLMRKDLEHVRRDVDALKAAEEARAKDWRERAWKVFLALGIGYLAVRLGVSPH